MVGLSAMWMQVFIYGKGKHSFATILRKHRGSFISALTGQFPGILPVRMAKALALREVCLWLSTGNYDYVDIESDAKVIVNVIESDSV